MRVCVLSNHKSNQKNCGSFLSSTTLNMSSQRRKQKKAGDEDPDYVQYRHLWSRYTLWETGFGFQTFCSTQLFVETKLFTVVSCLNGLESLQKFWVRKETYRHLDFNVESTLGVQLNQANSTRSRTHLRPSSKYGFLLVGNKRSRGIILIEKSYI